MPLRRDMPVSAEGNWSDLDGLPCAIVQTDKRGRISKASRTFSLWLETDEPLEGKRLHECFDASGRIFFETHLRPIIQMQGFVREVMCRLQTRGGTLPVLVNARAREAGEEQAEIITFLFVEVREREEYERALREERNRSEQLASVARAAKAAIIRVDEMGTVLAWNPAAEQFFGVGSEAAVGKRIEDLVQFDKEPAWFSSRIGQFEESSTNSHRFEVETLGDRYFDVSIDLITVPQDPLVRDWSIIIRDVTREFRYKRHIELLVDEMNHRVRNTMTIVNGIARQSFREMADLPQVQNFLQRIGVYAELHSMLTQSRDMNIDLHSLLKLSQRAQISSAAIRLEGPQVILEPKQATIFLLAFHELMTNATKYGALSVPKGRVDVTWQLLDDQLSICWQEKDGPPVSRPSRIGFGSRMLRKALALESGGAVDLRFEPAGVVCEILIPFARSSH